MKRFFCLLAMAIFAAPLTAQDIGSASTQSDREILLRMAVQLDQVSQVVASMQKSVDNHTAQLAALSARVDAIQFERSSVPATAPVANPWNVSTSTQAQPVMMQQGYGGYSMGGMTQSGGARRGIFARRGGGCGAGG